MIFAWKATCALADKGAGNEDDGDDPPGGGLPQQDHGGPPFALSFASAPGPTSAILVDDDSNEAWLRATDVITGELGL